MKTRRDLLKQFPLLAGGAVIASCAGIPILPQYIISNQMILKELLPHFPYNKSFAGIGSMSLTSPQISFVPDINKVRLNMGLGLGLSQQVSEITGINIPGLTSGSTQQNGSCQVACGLRYDRNTRGIYLKDLAIESLQLSNIGNSYTSNARSLVNAFAPAILDKTPIHTLEPSIATKFLGSMTIQNNGIALGFGL